MSEHRPDRTLSAERSGSGAGAASRDARELGRESTVSFAALIADPRPLAVLVPVGSVEPHGPHLGLLTDTAISLGVCRRAAAILEDEHDVLARIAPAVSYGVTECAAGFAGAVSVPSDVLTGYLQAIIAGLVRARVDHVCLVNNHLEPDHDRAVRAAAAAAEPGRASVACPLTRRWARTLSPEFKSGACHAGRYETSLVLAHAPELVDRAAADALDPVPISLSDQLRQGVSDFRAMGLSRAYAGDPAAASADEGEALYARLSAMAVTEVLESLGRAPTERE